MTQSAFRESLQLLYSRRFGTFWFASLLSSVGTWAQQVAQPWLLLSLGASSFVLGLDTFAMSAPVFALTLYGGELADRADRRRVITLFQSIQMLCPTLLVLLLLHHRVQWWMIVVLSLLVGITDALSLPSFQTIVPSIVAPAQIPAGVALNSTQLNLSRMLGPALAGILMASVGAAGAFAVSALSYVPFILVALWVLPANSAAPRTVGGVDFRHQWITLRAILARRGLRGSVLTVFVSSLLCSQLITFSPVLVGQAMHGTVGHFSIAVGAFGVGGLLGALLLLLQDEQRDRRVMASSFAALSGAVVALAALDRYFWLLPLLFVAAGVALTASNALANTLLLSWAPLRIRGQAVSVYMLAMRGGMAIGALLTGAAVTLLGVRIALILNGALAVACQLAILRDWRREPQRPVATALPQL